MTGSSTDTPTQQAPSVLVVLVVRDAAGWLRGCLAALGAQTYPRLGILAVDNAAVDGERIEGKGVAPTIEVPFDIRYAAGKDPQLDKAVELLANGA